MIKKTAISLIGEDELLCQVRKHAEFILFKEEDTHIRSKTTLIVHDENKENVQTLLLFCEKLGLHPHIYEWVSFTKKEYEEAEFFQMKVPQPLEREGTVALDYGTKYVGGCQICGLGSTPESSIYVDAKLLKKEKIASLRPEWYASPEIKDLICDHKLSGVHFRQELKDYKGRSIPQFFHMDIANTLQPMSEKTWLIPDDTPFSRKQFPCGHYVNYLRSSIYYEKEKLISACDFNKSFEYVNNFREPVIIVSKKVRDLFRAAKIRAGFHPVIIVQ